MNPLDKFPQIRAALYFVQWLVNGVLTLAGAYFLVAQTAIDDLPSWYVYTIALAPVLWTYLGITAQTNVNPKPVEQADDGSYDVASLPTDTLHGGDEDPIG